MAKEESPIPYLQFHCITIKTTIPSAPVKLDSPLEAYSCIGRLARACSLPCPEAGESLQDMIAELRKAMEGVPAPTEQAERMKEILFSFGRDHKPDDRMREILHYAYEHEKQV